MKKSYFFLFASKFYEMALIFDDHFETDTGPG